MQVVLPTLRSLRSEGVQAKSTPWGELHLETPFVVSPVRSMSRVSERTDVQHLELQQGKELLHESEQELPELDEDEEVLPVDKKLSKNNR